MDVRSNTVATPNGPLTIQSETFLHRLPRIYRFLDEKDHAEAFVKGNIWVTTFAACRAREGSDVERGDAYEGKLIHQIDELNVNASDPQSVKALTQTGIFRTTPETHGVNVRKINLVGGLGDAFMLCLTDDPDLSGFGAHGIRITNPYAFWSNLLVAMRNRFPLRAALFAGVTYAKRVVRDREVLADLEEAPPPLLKPWRFRHQSEIRMIWQVAEGYRPIEPFLLECGAVSKYCSLVQ